MSTVAQLNANGCSHTIGSRVELCLEYERAFERF
jgi:hypothetical protein